MLFSTCEIWLREKATPEAERVAADRCEEHPDYRIKSPCQAFRGVGAAFASE